MSTNSSADTFIEIEEFEDHFARVPKYALADKRISLKAKGLYAYLSGLPKNWKLYRSQMLDHLSDGKDSLNSAFKELESYGYLISTPMRDKGQFKGYKLKVVIKPSDTPLRENRSGLTGTDLTVSGKSATNKNDSIKIDNTLAKANDNNVLPLNDQDLYTKFINEINKLLGREFKKVASTKQLFIARVKAGYTYDNIISAVKNAMKAKNHIENNFNYLTPGFILKVDKLELYSNFKPSDTEQKTDGKTQFVTL